MHDLANQRCANHEFREAVARCPECGNYFCRECIVEHEGRVVCAACLKRLTAAQAKGRRRFGLLVAVGQCLLGILTVWLFFYLVGRALVSLPSSFHEGTIWRTHWWEEQ